MSESLELHKDIQSINYEITTQNQLIKTLLSLQKDELLNQKKAIFIGENGPKERLIRLYLAIGSQGKTRKDLEELGFKPGTIRPYLNLLKSEAILQVKETRPEGQEVFGYTVVEEISRLSLHLNSLLSNPH
jgi:hypothetical protein